MGQPSSRSLPRIALISTGGTLSMDPDLRFSAKQASKSRPTLLTLVPELERLARCTVVPLPPLDSCQMDPVHWRLIAQEIQKLWSRFDGFVVLHGTDTMVYTANALRFLLGPITKPVILTGSQRPLSALRTDARRNLISSVEIAAQGPKAHTHRVSLFFDRFLHDPFFVRKISASQLDAFSSAPGPVLAQVGTEIEYLPGNEKNFLSPAVFRLLCKKPDFTSPVLTLPVSPLTPWDFYQDFKNIAGILLIPYPSGTAPTENASFRRFLKRTQAAKVPVVLCPDHQSPVQPYESTQTLLCQEGVLLAPRWSVEACTVLLSVCLGQRDPHKTLSKIYSGC